MCASEVGGYLPRVVGPVFLSLFCFCILNVGIYLLVFAISALLVGDCETLSAHRGVSVWALPLVFMRAHAGGVILISRARGLHAGKPKLMLRKRGARARAPRSAPLAICSRYLISIYFSD